MMTVYEGIKGELSSGTVSFGRVEYTVAEFRDDGLSRYEGVVRAKPSVLKAARGANALNLDHRRIVLGNLVSSDCAAFDLTGGFL